MSKSYLNKDELIGKMHELKGRMSDDECCLLRINNILDLIDRFPDLSIEITPSIKYFILTYDNPSRLMNLNATLDSMIDEMRSIIKMKQQQYKETAIIEMRKSKKGFIIVVMVALGIIAGGAVTLGVLSAIGKISNVWCDIVGVLDCMGGILFFVYELYDDKIRETKINNGDVEEIGKYTKSIDVRPPIQINNGAQVNNGTVYGRMNMTVVNKPSEIKNILDKVFEKIDL